MKRISVIFCAAAAFSASACVSTNIEGYADREAPSQPLGHIAVLVAAAPTTVAAVQSAIVSTASLYGVVADDALTILPPTREYTPQEAKQDLIAAGADAVLVVAIGDSGIQKEYAGTILSANYAGTTVGSFNGGGLTLNSYGSSFATATPMYRRSRETTFQARLIEIASGRVLWVGSGQVQASGALFVGNAVSASHVADSICTDLREKGLLKPVS
jgi:hypothetical protein